MPENGSGRLLPSPDAVIDAFVDHFNARSLSPIEDLLAGDVWSSSFDAAGRDGVLKAIGELWLRRPGVQLSRADEGDAPVASIWVPDEDGRYVATGYLDLEIEAGRVTKITHVDTPGRNFVAGQAPRDHPADWEHGTASDPAHRS